MRFTFCFIFLFSLIAVGCLSRRAKRMDDFDSSVDVPLDAEQRLTPPSSFAGNVADGYCGDGILNRGNGELCDTSSLGGQTCTSLGFAGGELLCDPATCLFNTIMCVFAFDAGRYDSGFIYRDSGKDVRSNVEDDAGSDDGGYDPDSREVVISRCARSTGASCSTDSDCVNGGCGGELCYNPAFGSVSTTCDCIAPSNLFCGCVRGSCTWWR